ncbi:MAG TPA: ATP-binding cassette domain-containing protein, partial [Halanaerobiales bacterium]|nr:ATP-binding cassette domain-containing protein [Halanaerobiales bacterium]
MAVLSMHTAKKSYGITEVLKGFSLTANDGERIGLIGPNGSGKTTILKIIAGFETVSGGELFLKKGIQPGYLSQIADFNFDNNTLYEELESVFIQLIETEEKLRKLEELITRKSHENKNKNLDKLMAEYSSLQHRFEDDGGYEYQSKIRQVASGMGFSLEELENKAVEKLSGGEKTRL